MSVTPQSTVELRSRPSPEEGSKFMNSEPDYLDNFVYLPIRKGARSAKQKAKPGHSRCRPNSGGLTISFANIISFSDKASHLLAHNASDCWMAVETHWHPAKSPQGGRTLREYGKLGWNLVCGPPQPSRESQSGCWGGVLAGVRKHLSFMPLAGALLLPEVRGTAWEADSAFLAGYQVAMTGYDLLVFGSYHRDGVNLSILSQVSARTHNGQLPFVLFGDFNDEPGVLDSTGWLARVDGVVLTAGGGTCASAHGRGEGRCIDYALVSRCIATSVVLLDKTWQVPFSPHAGLTLHLSRNPKLLRETTIRNPPSRLPADFGEILSSISEAELVSRWQSISESQVAAALRVAGRLGHMGSRFDSATKPLEFQLSSWCTTFDLWSAGLVGKDVSDEAVLKKIVGRGLPAEYVSGFVPRVRRSSHGDIKVPGGLNAPARAAATVANIAKKMAAQPSCQ